MKKRTIGPADVTWLSLVIIGEGWHNFHHVFPWDYRSTDVGLYYHNLATMFIDLMAKIGWAYHLKVVPDHVIRRRALRTGDGSHFPSEHNPLNGTYSSTDDYDDKALVKQVDKQVDQNKNKLNVDTLDVGDIEPAPWGWGDGDIPADQIHDTIITDDNHGFLKTD